VLDAGGDANVRASVALVWDYEAKWLFEIHPQGADFHYPRIAFEYYSALRSLGLDVDVVPSSASFEGYRMVVVPPLPIVPDEAQTGSRSGWPHAARRSCSSPRTGSKTAHLTIPTHCRRSRDRGAAADPRMARRVDCARASSSR